MRVTGGDARGCRLKMPAGPKIRPTRDMVREAVFDILGERIAGSRFLDLFAGTGSCGIEALSRGAREAVFVERSRFCIEAIRANLEKTRLAERGRLVRGDVFAFLEKARSQECVDESTFDIIFADPPYEARKAPGPGAGVRTARKPSRKPAEAGSWAKRALQVISASNILAHGAIVVIEHPAQIHLPEEEGILFLSKSRRYGSTGMSFYRLPGSAQNRTA